MHDCFDVEVSLREIEPRIWRRFLLAAEATFLDLHEAIQDSAGWMNCHLFAFRDEKTRDAIAGIPENDYGEPDPNAERVYVSDWIGTAAKNACVYEYDFGDSWEHDVVVRRAQHEDAFERRLLGGERAFPHEDCGGVGGYERFCKIVIEGVDPWNEPIKDSLRWLGGWHPQKFDLETAKNSFDRSGPALRASRRRGGRPPRRPR